MRRRLAPAVTDAARHVHGVLPERQRKLARISDKEPRTMRRWIAGTALALGEVVAAERGSKLSDVAVFDRHGSNTERRVGDIGFTVLRAGDIVGEHTVTFAIAGERVEITHRATDRTSFARGALLAAEWLPGRPPGLYTMDQVLGFGQP